MKIQHSVNVNKDQESSGKATTEHEPKPGAMAIWRRTKRTSLVLGMNTDSGLVESRSVHTDSGVTKANATHCESGLLSTQAQYHRTDKKEHLVIFYV